MISDFIRRFSVATHIQKVIERTIELLIYMFDLVIKLSVNDVLHKFFGTVLHLAWFFGFDHFFLSKKWVVRKICVFNFLLHTKTCGSKGYCEQGWSSQVWMSYFCDNAYRCEWMTRGLGVSLSTSVDKNGQAGRPIKLD